VRILWCSVRWIRKYGMLRMRILRRQSSDDASAPQIHGEAWSDTFKQKVQFFNRLNEGEGMVWYGGMYHTTSMDYVAW
jgi:hypothetical protein